MEALLKKYQIQTLSSALLALLIFSLPFERIPSIDLLAGQVTIRPNQPIAVILICSVAGVMWRQRSQLLKIPRVILVIFLLFLLLSTLQALDLQSAARVAIATGLTCVTAIAVTFSFAPRDLSEYEKALLWCTWLVIILGAFQYFGDSFGLDSSITGLAPNYVKDVFGFPRIQSTALEPLYLASFLLIPFSVLSSRELLHAKTRSVTLFAVTTTLVLTVSRGGIIGGVVVAILLLGFSLGFAKVSWVKAIRFGGIMIAASLFAYTLTFSSSLFVTNKGPNQKYSSEKKTQEIVKQTLNFDSQDDRIRNRRLAWDAFKEQPVFGIGPGNFDLYAKEAYPGYRQSPRVIVNNEPLELLAETGAVGFLALALFFIGLAVAACRYLMKMLRTKTAISLADVFVVGLFSYLFATAIQYQTFSTLYIMHIWVAIGLLMAIVVRAPVRTNKNSA